MKLLVLGSGMMGSAAAYDMARQPEVHSVTLADNDARRAREMAARINHIDGDRKVRAVTLNASDEKAAARLMKGHNGTLSAVPYFLNLGLTRAAIQARCHFADLSGNNTVVRQQLALAGKAEKAGVAIAPDCGLAPGMASILGGELVRRLDGPRRRAQALRRRPARKTHAALSLSTGVLGRRAHQRVRRAGPHSASWKTHPSSPSPSPKNFT